MMLLGWIGLSVLVGVLGEKRAIGFMWGMFLSLLLSPLLGFIIVMCSSRKPEDKTEILKADYLERLVKMKQDGVLTDEEYIRLSTM